MLLKIAYRRMAVWGGTGLTDGNCKPLFGTAHVRDGSKQTWRHRIVMSALTPKADIDRQPIDVR